MYNSKNKIHFVGIGGSGMCGIAEVLLNLGHIITGSDLSENDAVKRLRNLGAKIYIGHSSKNVDNVDVVVKSTAVSKNNAEIIEAQRKRIPVIPRAEMLGELMRLKFSVAIAGTHGKTTTTSMVAMILNEAGLDPTVVIGGRLNQLESNARLGKGKYLVAEADESDGSFLKLYPTVAVVTNIDEDHLDFYKDIGQIKNVFLEFVNKIPFYGFAVLSLDDENVQNLIPYLEKRYVTFGLHSQAFVTPENISTTASGTAFSYKIQGVPQDEIRMKVFGIHNVYNALAAIATAVKLGIDKKTIKAGLEKFSGVDRRFQKKFENERLSVFDDYGHHPREVEMTLHAARQIFDGTIIAVFQPHRYSRTQHMYDSFGKSFFDADELIVTDIYPAGEAAIEGVTSKLVAGSCISYGHSNVQYIADKKDIADVLMKRLKKDETERIMIITLGAGDVYKIGEELIEKI